ncbi:hypothetical protein [Tissierella pigra]|uniref:Uncharacterized protein n=1 Tax=Tissierella pigra TaxID=2607614 RepID=A0A6N7Y015_9FIRM|nr:hypothetical protein [Tissierella pigra]MSU01390.1 hypothetical protein [Tissierella pigra]
MIKTFEDALDMCDYDIKVKFAYLDNLLCDLDDDISEVFEEIAYAEVDEEICNRLIESDFEDERERLFKINQRQMKLAEELDYLQVKYDIVEDLYEEVLFNILANID